MVKSSFEDHLSVRYTRWVLRNRWKVILASIGVILTLGAGSKHLGFTNDYRVFFGETNPQLLAFEEVENTYTKTDNVMLIVTPKEGDVFSPSTLGAIQELTKRAWQIPHSTRVDSITNFQHTKAKGDDLYVGDLVSGDPKRLSDRQLQEIRRTALVEPSLYKRLINPSATITGVNASIQLPGKDPNEVIEVTQYVRNLRKDFLKDHPNLEIRISGVVLMNNAFAESGQKDAMTLTPIMYLSMIFIMALLLRSIGASFAALLVIILSTIGAMGFTGWVGILLTPPSAVAPTIILTLAVADSIHILMSMLLLMRKGWKKEEALTESLRINMQAIFLTSLTTSIGFLCLNFSDSPPYHHLGNITAFGVLVAYALSVTFLPAITTLIPILVKQTQPASASIIERFANFVTTRSKIILLLTSTLAIVLASVLPRLELTDQFVRWFDHRVEFRRDTDYMMENLTGIYSFEYSLHSGESEGISRPEFLGKVEEFSQFWRKHPETIHVSTFSDVMKRLNQNMHADDPKWYRLPNDLNLASQYLLLYEMSLPFGLDLANQMDIDKSSIRLVITLKESSSSRALEIAKEGDQWLVENAPGSMHASATGPTVMFSHISTRNIKSMLKGTALALLLITLVMIVSLRSLKYGLISLFPNALPALMAFGLWTLLYKQAGMAISIVASATLGIIVDDSVHFITKFLRAKREEGKSTAQAIQYAFSTVGLALIVTSFILVVGFGVMSHSSFLLNESLGVLSAITIAFALFMDFFFLPALLLTIKNRNNATTP